MKKSTVLINNTEITIIKRKYQKKIYVKISKRGEIEVSSPFFVSDKYIRDFLIREYESILELKKSREIDDISYENGSVHYLFGQKYALDIRENKHPSVVTLDDKMIINISSVENIEKKEKMLEKFYKEKLEEKISQIVPKYENMMNLHASEYRIKKMKTRWGTCNITKKRIWVNLELAKKDVSCLEYIIVHELVHLLEKNHNARFYSIVEKYYPNYRQVKKSMDNI